MIQLQQLVINYIYLYFKKFLGCNAQKEVGRADYKGTEFLG